MDIAEFINKHELPDGYAKLAEQWFFPVFDQIASARKQTDRPLIVGVNGSQGSGKSTFSDLLCFKTKQTHDLNVLSLSIDDFYLTRFERESLAESIHPLLKTRGVPGTHDVEMAIDAISRLVNFSSPVAIPRFDKSKDDRFTADQWGLVDTQPDIIILEGWCVGAVAQSDRDLVAPVNSIESDEDSGALWRNYVNEQLKFRYPALFSQIDIWVMLKAPSFDCVFDWRLEQEEKLSRAMSIQGKDPTGIMDREAILRFIQHYQRITEYTLKTLPDKVNYLYELDEQREIMQLTNPVALSL